jgi:geranylgeranyl diphosphate synthase type I
MIRYHFGYDAPGERIRQAPAAAVAPAHRARRGRPDRVRLDAAVAIEILHNYSLVHDDIEDGDELRHGRTTIWARYGVAQGINAGDALCAISYLTLLHEEAVVPPNRVVEMLHVLHEANLLMCEGQSSTSASKRVRPSTMDAVSRNDRGQDGRALRRLVRTRSARGRSRAGARREYARLGRAYGLAFQIRDDVLGTWGRARVTGKPSGADIARRKWSFPVVWALDTPPSADRDIVARAYARNARASMRRASSEVIAALDRLGARAAADDAHDRALDDADRIACHASIDVNRTIRDFLAQGARRVA